MTPDESSVPAGEASREADEEVLKHFWDLVSLETETRKASARALVDGIVRDAQTAGASGEGTAWPPLTDYCVKRLVRGLASSNKGARQGFATALASATQQLAQAGAADLFSMRRLVDDMLPVAGNSAKRSEAKDAALGRMFAFASLSRSGLASDAASAGEIVEELIAIGSTTAPLREAAYACVADLILRLPSEEAVRTIENSSSLRAALCESPEDATPEALSLAISLWGVLPDDILQSCTLLPRISGADRPSPAFPLHSSAESWPERAADAFFRPEHLQAVSQPLKAAAAAAPRIHSAWLSVLSLLCPGFAPLAWGSRPGASAPGNRQPKHEHVAAAWSVLVEGPLLGSASHSRHHLAFHLCQIILPRCSAPSVPVVLGSQLLGVAATHHSQKDSHLHSAAKALVSRIKSVAARAEDESARLAIVIALQNHGSSGFDASAKANVTDDLLGSVAGEELEAYLTQLQERFVSAGESAGAARGKEGEEGRRHERTQVWCVDQMVSVIKAGKAGRSARDDVFDFLAVHALLARGPNAELKKAAKKNKALLGLERTSNSRDVREHCAARLLQLVADAGVVAAAEAGAKATGKKGKADADSRKHSNAAQEEAQRGAVRRALEIVKAAAPGAVPAALEDASGGEAGERQAKDEIAGALSALDRARKAAEKGGDDPRSVALGRLAEVLALYVMAVPDKVDLGIAEDVGAVAERLGGGEKKGKGKKGEAGAEEPHWSEVLVDLILALLSGSFKPVPGAVLRGVLEGAFSACAGDMTRAALESMTAVLSRPLSGGEEEDEEEMEMEVDEDVSDGEEGEEKGGEETEGEEEEEANGTGKGGENPMSALDKALADMKEDGDDESLPDLDDDAMFEMDENIAAMVRQAKDQKRQAAEARQALLALKFRALSLLDAFLTKHPASPHTPFLAAPLLRALRAAAAPSGDAQLATRLAVVVSERLSKGKIQGAAGLAKDDAKELLRSSLVAVARAPTGPDAGVVLEAAERVAMYAVRVTSHRPGTEANAQPVVHPEGMAMVAQELGRSAKDFFMGHSSRMRKQFFSTVLRDRAPEAGIQMLPQLLKLSNRARNETKRADAMDLVVDVLSRNPKAFAKSIAAQLKPSLPLLVDAASSAAHGGFSKRRSQGQALKAATEAVSKVVSVFSRNDVAFSDSDKDKMLGACNTELASEGVPAKIRDMLRRLVSILGGEVDKGVGGGKKKGGEGKGGKGLDGKKNKGRDKKGGEGGEGKKDKGGDKKGAKKVEENKEKGGDKKGGEEGEGKKDKGEKRKREDGAEGTKEKKPKKGMAEGKKKGKKE